MPLPTRGPALGPSTSVPSGAPTMTGLLASFAVTAVVTSSLSESDIASIEAQVVLNFDSDVETTVAYTATGSMVISADDLTNEEVIDSISLALAHELGVHVSEVEVTYDDSNGLVSYTITSDTAETLSSLVEEMESDSFAESLIIDDISIEIFEAPEEMVVTVDVVVDASNVDNPESTAILVHDALESLDESYQIDADSNFRLPVLNILSFFFSRVIRFCCKKLR